MQDKKSWEIGEFTGIFTMNFSLKATLAKIA